MDETYLATPLVGDHHLRLVPLERLEHQCRGISGIVM